MSEIAGSDPMHPIDNPTGWVAKNIEEYLKTDGKKGSALKSAPLLLLTTQGRKSGKWRRTALIFGESAGSYIVVASRGGAPTHPAWYRNLTANPRVHVQVYDRTFAATARTASAAERPALWSIMSEIWPDYPKYAKKTTREIPVVILDPVE